MSTASKSRIALEYSARFSRCSAGLPGLGFAIDARSIDISIEDAKASTLALSGLGIPSGGIAPARTLRITFSHISACAGTFERSAVSSVKPAIFVFELWHVTQYWSSSARLGAGVWA